MAYSDNFPSQRPSFMFDASNAGRIPPNMTYSRASSANVWDGSKHLSSENLISYSNDVSQSNWIKDGFSATGGQTAPDGGTDAYKLTENSANDEHRIYQSASERITSSGSLTVSVHLKYIGRQWAVIRLTSPSGNRRVWFDIQNGLVGSTNSEITASISASGNGYYKCVATISSVATSPGTYVMIGGADADNSYVYTGSGSDAFAIWGIQASTTGETVLNETSGSIHRQYASSLVSKANNIGRFEVGTDGQSGAKGLLIEGQATSLVTYSEDSTQWTKAFSASTATASSAVGPDGTLNASLWVPGATAQTHYVHHGSVSVTSGTAYTGSVFLKGVNNTRAQLAFGSGGMGYGYANFSLSGSGSVLATGGGASASISSCGNGWFRATLTATAVSTTSTSGLIVGYIDSDSDTRLPTKTGNAYNGLLVTGFQFESGSHASSYLKSNSGSTTTRALDSLSMPIASTGYTGGPMTLVTDTTVSDPTSTQFRAAAYVYVDSSNAAGIWATSSDSRIARVETGGIGGNVGTNSGVNGKAALSIDTNDIAACLNGGTVATDTSHALTDFGSATLYVGNFGTYANQLNGHVKRIALFNEALSDQNLISLTS